MIDLKNATLALGLVVAAAAASPALANSRAAHPGYNARAEALGGAGDMNLTRATALRQCNTEANKFTQYTWGNWQGDQLRACMAEHGQPE